LRLEHAAVSALEVLERAHAAGVRAWVDGDQLIFEADAPPSDELIDLIRQHKVDILRTLCESGNALPAEKGQAAEHSAAPQPVHSSALTGWQGCSQCSHRTRFGNCGRPVEAKLSERFMLVAHPTQGAGCKVFEPRMPAEVLALLRRVDDALTAHAIDSSDAEAARASIQEHSDDPAYLAEWSTLLDWCMQVQRRARPD